MGRLSQFANELKRRNVFRMAALYLVVSWLIIQVADVLIDLIGMPDWIGRTLLWLLAVGFPIALVISWVFEVTPQGLKLEKEAAEAAAIDHATGRRMNLIVISVLMAAVILFAADKWWLRKDPGADLPAANSIAVMAFANRSMDPEQEYFSDGISEELLNLLARIPDLKVISRASSFYFKNKDMQLADIAAQLNVAYILDGSVRKDGKNVRITAQLIEAGSDSYLWSQTYDRELSSIFELQDEIAEQVVSKLKVFLLGELPKAPRADPEAFNLLLEARHFRLLQTSEGLGQAQGLYERALEIDPDYARAWVGLSNIYRSQVNIGGRPALDGYRLAEEAARKALELDPNSAAAYEKLAAVALARDSDLKSAAHYLQKALALDPDDLTIQASAGIFLQNLGRIDEAILYVESYIQHDPVHAIAHFTLGDLYLYKDDLQMARASLSKALGLSPGYVGAHYLLGLIDLFEGRPDVALERFESEPDDEYRIKGRALAFFDMGRKEDSDAALDELISNWGQYWRPEVAHVYAYRGEIDNAFEWLAEENESSGGWGVGRRDSLLRNLHGDPRWESFLIRTGVSDKDLSAIAFEIDISE